MNIAKYTVNEVEERTGIPAGTLRQWERRYGLPKPERSAKGYRLYSDADIQHIDAMKRYVGDGIPASRAAELVKRRPQPSSEGPTSDALYKSLVDALIDFDEGRADAVLSEAHTIHTVEKVMTEIMRPAIIGIGQRWHDGEITTSAEHFASNYIQGRLRSLMTLASRNLRPQAPIVMVACAPLDQHEIGALMLAVTLRRSGYQVYYIGANTPVEDLQATAALLKPVAVLISATTEDSLHQLRAKRSFLANMAPLLVFGGTAFEHHPEEAEALGGRFLAANAPAAIEMLDRSIATVERSA